jgi:type VI secretion system protein VasG
MVQVDLKRLLNRLNAYVKRSLETAAGLCISRGNYEVSVDHLFLVMLDDEQRDLSLILKRFEIDAVKLKTELLRQVEAMKIGNSGRPVFSPTLIEFLSDAWLVSSVDLGLAQIRSGALVATVLTNNARYGQDWSDQLRKIS